MPMQGDILGDKTLYEWKENSRNRYVLEFLRLDGCSSVSDRLSPGCLAPAKHPAHRCRECKGGVLYCKQCCEARHLENPLHIVDVGMERVELFVNVLEGAWVEGAIQPSPGPELRQS
ncbi:hypothetical protein MVEN_01685500 [Mycena venus]|uniref:Uncharacterized protein n=1 Tax=Mycena venus TaxID=2733690 RepID=A0A8H7CQP2_9AGAR|nr:hypothetical protein MVEN_01685500 [Mycena venus]